LTRRATIVHSSAPVSVVNWTRRATFCYGSCTKRKKPRSDFGIRSNSRIHQFFSNLAKTASLSKEVTSFERIAILARLLTMVTNTKSLFQIHKLQKGYRDNRFNPFVTPSTNKETQRKRLRLRSPILPHAISNLRTPVRPEIVVETGLDDDTEEGKVVDEEEGNQVDAEVELDEATEEEEELSDDIDIAVGTTSEFNLLVPQTDLFQFISTNFVCRECHN
jgi:hypothetical protein